MSAGGRLALVLAAVALSVAAAMAATAGTDGSADSTPQPPTGSGALVGDVTPTLLPKADLPVADEVNVAVAPDMPPPIRRTGQAIVEVHFEVVENVSTIDPSGTEHETWGYRLVGGPDNGLVIGTPGPVIRTRVGDVLRFTITNPADNSMPHNVDLHAVTGQGGGAEATTVNPGETRTIEARLLYPGFFMYHCAYGDVPAHISHGMYGGILVDPETPLPSVDHEWYIVQSEYYVAADGGLDRAAVTNEQPTHVVFNGAVGAIAGDNALTMAVGESARIYFVNAGLNLISSFHPIGSHWDAVYPEAALLNAPLRGSQTTLVPAGGGTVVELIGQVPQTIVLVDHALARTFDKGAAGHIVITGDPDREIFEEVVPGEAPTAGPTRDDEPTSEAPAGTGVVHDVSILDGSITFQADGAPDEFADSENPADYSVNVLDVAVGDTVRWTNDDPAIQHTATSVDGLFDSGLLASGGTFDFTFTEPGEYEFFCTPHPWMRAKVIVTG